MHRRSRGSNLFAKCFLSDAWRIVSAVSSVHLSVWGLRYDCERISDKRKGKTYFAISAQHAEVERLYGIQNMYKTFGRHLRELYVEKRILFPFSFECVLFAFIFVPLFC